jgi:hypothetical protein
MNAIPCVDNYVPCGNETVDKTVDSKGIKMHYFAKVYFGAKV